MRAVLKAAKALPPRLLQMLIYLVALRWLAELVALVRGNIDLGRRGHYLRDVRRGRPLRCAPRCAVIRPDVYRRADPLIYSQRYLMEQGLAVTWNNPDIQLFENGVPVSSSTLEADTEYAVVATIHNNSLDAPAVGLQVEFAFQSFGVGAVLTPIGTTSINLPVKGAPQHPAAATMMWRTPATPGHYCLKVQLLWADDANPKNNMGQENTNVAAAASPAVFQFPVRNDDTIPKRIRMEADAYVIAPPLDCRERPTKEDSARRHPRQRRLDVFIPPSEEPADWTLARVRHGAAAFPIPMGWQVDIQPREFSLAVGDTQNVAVTITPPNDFLGQRPFNVNAMHGTGLLGGVTLVVTR